MNLSPHVAKDVYPLLVCSYHLFFSVLPQTRSPIVAQLQNANISSLRRRVAQTSRVQNWTLIAG